MSYDRTDPRATLNTGSTKTRQTTGLVAEEQLGLFYETSPQTTDDTTRTWLLRGHNFVLAQSDCKAGAVLSRKGQPDEYVILLTDDNAYAIFEWAGERVEHRGAQIAFVPAGNSRLILPEGGRVTRLFTVASRDLVDLCPNSAAYDVPREHIPAFKAWPEPNDGWRIHHYSLDIPSEEGRFGRIFRCTTFMVNVLEPMVGPRDPAKMSPHHHDDFEQCSLLLNGRFTHHLRWPWTTNLADWCDDKHLDVGAPSALVIPPPVIHTSQATGSADNNLVDIFCPPRMDFSQKDGWVVNAGDYPTLEPLVT